MTDAPRDPADDQELTELSSTETHGPSEEAPEQIGPYRLLEKLGEGGMGEVWLAEQQHPVKRKVALKVIKQGMDTKQVVARFEAEKQALAMMDHPAIAKVYDAGATPRGISPPGRKPPPVAPGAGKHTPGLGNPRRRHWGLESFGLLVIAPSRLCTRR